MNRLLALVVPVALLMGTGCVVEAHSHRPVVRRAAYIAPAAVVEYRFAGAHPVPDDYGGGWCPEDYAHVHDYQPPQASYVYTDDVYYYRGPTVVWYWDYHPTPSGAYCNFHGRHQHDFYPQGSWGAGYSYDRGTRGYRWSNSHSASAVPGGRNNIAPSRPAPAPAPVNQGRNAPPGGTGTGARPPSGSSWGRGNNAAPSNNARDNDRDNDRDNSRNSGGWDTPASKSRDDDKDNNRGNSNSGSSNSGNSGSSGRSSGGWSTPPSGNSGGGSSGSSGGRSSGGSSGSSGNSGSSGGGWNTGKSSGSSGRSGSGW
ncbi:hypothetical protein D7V77_07330 [Corallococcus sp. CA041A]|uniref:hypothetical protein n=1 Tax=Corallococcus sp. CA041A TaxID=2316727 RepID=UPI000EA3F9C6|nr:hypothetical protein [Corallococcus sp. CA041A]RKH28931.1 hypothetical protein D7V77_07330 [Corallococcus sp. CA041A]